MEDAYGEAFGHLLQDAENHVAAREEGLDAGDNDLEGMARLLKIYLNIRLDGDENIEEREAHIEAVVDGKDLFKIMIYSATR